MSDEPEEPANGQSVSVPFMGLIESFLMNVEALRDLLSVAPSVGELDSMDSRFGGFREALERIPEEDRGAAKEILLRHIRKIRKAVKAQQKKQHLVEAVSEEDFEERQVARTHFSYSAMLDEIVASFPTKYWTVELITGLGRAFARPPREELLLQSLIVSLVSAYEVLLAGLVGTYYRAKPGALNPTEREKEFSLEDLRQLGSIEEALQLAIDRRVEDFLWLSVDEWNGWFKKHLKVDFETASLDWPETHELFERRHIIVHNGGRVSGLYLRRLDNPEGLHIGDHLHVTNEYVSRAIDLVLVHGVLLLLKTWTHSHKSQVETAATSLARTLYEQMLLARWEVVRALSDAGRQLKCTDSGRWTFTCNWWLARKRIEGLQAVEAEIRDWDPSALSLRYRVVRHALLDEVDTVLELLPQALSSSEIDNDDAYQWPILEEVRASPGFALVMAGGSVTTTLVSSGSTVASMSGRVYARPGAKRYHRRSCRYLGVGAKSIRRETAVSRGLSPCARCSP